MNPGTGYPAQYPAARPVIGPNPAGPVLSPPGMINLLLQWFVCVSLSCVPPFLSVAVAMPMASARTSRHQKSLICQVTRNKRSNHFFQRAAGVGNHPHTCRDEHGFQRPRNRTADEDIRAQLDNASCFRDGVRVLNGYLLASHYSIKGCIHQQKPPCNVEYRRDPVSVDWEHDSHLLSSQQYICQA
jgi:hypothetical protein